MDWGLGYVARGTRWTSTVSWDGLISRISCRLWLPTCMGQSMLIELEI